MEWAGAPGQTPDRLRAAIGPISPCPRMTPADEVVRGEGVLIERTIRLPADDLKDMLLEGSGWNSPEHPVPIWAMLWIDMITTPWSATRAVRLSRLLTSEEARRAALEPWQRPTNRPSLWENELGPGRERFSLVTLLASHIESAWAANDRNEVTRRALVQVMAVREWQLRHGGRFPTGSTTWCPISCLSCRPTRTPAGPSATPHSPWPRRTGRINGRSPNLPAETRLIYSAGTDGRDDGGLFHSFGIETPGDMVFPIRPLPVE